MTTWILERRTKRSEFEYQESSSGRKPSRRDETRPGKGETYKKGEGIKPCKKGVHRGKRKTRAEKF